MTGQVALILADVYGMSDQESAGRLEMPVLRFEQLLDRTRNRMHQRAGGRCALVGNPPADAPDDAPGTDNPEAAPFPEAEQPQAEPIEWKVDENRLRMLRRLLLNQLGL